MSPSKRSRVCTGCYPVDKLPPTAQERLGTRQAAHDWLDTIAEGRGSNKFLLAQVDRRTSDEHEIQLTVRSMDHKGTLDHRSLPLSFQGELVAPLCAWFDRIVKANGGADSPNPLCVLISGWSAAVVKHQDHVYFGRHVLFPGRTCIAWLPRDRANPSIFEFPHKNLRPIVYASDDAAWAAYGGRSQPRSSSSATVTALEAPPSSAPSQGREPSSESFDFDTPPNSGRIHRQPFSEVQQPPSPLPAGRNKMSRFAPEPPQVSPAPCIAPVDPDAAMVDIPVRESLFSDAVSPLKTDANLHQVFLDKVRPFLCIPCIGDLTSHYRGGIPP